MDSPTLEELHSDCVRTLKRLIAEANRTCALLETMTEFPITLEIWQKALDQRVRENYAQDRYQTARERLFGAINPKNNR